MEPWLENLLILQDKDLRIAKLQEIIEAIPGEKTQAQDMLEAAETAVAAAKSQVQDAEKHIKSVETKVESLQAHMDDFKTKSLAIKSNDDYRAAMKQIDQTKKRIGDLEEDELEYMEKLEEARTTRRQCEKDLKAAQARVNAMIQDLDTREQNCNEKITELKQERGEVAAAVPKDVLSRYERMRKGRRQGDRRVLVPVRDDICDGCHMKVTAQTKMDMRKGKPVTCNNCALLVYLEE